MIGNFVASVVAHSSLDRLRAVETRLDALGTRCDRRFATLASRLDRLPGVAEVQPLVVLPATDEAVITRADGPPSHARSAASTAPARARSSQRPPAASHASGASGTASAAPVATTTGPFGSAAAQTLDGTLDSPLGRRWAAAAERAGRVNGRPGAPLDALTQALTAVLGITAPVVAGVGRLQPQPPAALSRGPAANARADALLKQAGTAAGQISNPLAWLPNVLSAPLGPGVVPGLHLLQRQLAAMGSGSAAAPGASADGGKGLRDFVATSVGRTMAQGSTDGGLREFIAATTRQVVASAVPAAAAPRAPSKLLPLSPRSPSAASGKASGVAPTAAPPTAQADDPQATDTLLAALNRELLDQAWQRGVDLR